ncbi:MAG: hypothetical protein Ct9H300mP19_16130 [Dehalococcoidia bacterium]|nr:MAG: hypothetical protein Ct9H300mP19_16130 [Dehalococcoidia bacterium]
MQMKVPSWKNDIVDDDVSHRAVELIAKRNGRALSCRGRQTVAGINSVIDFFLNEHGQIDIWSTTLYSLINHALFSIRRGFLGSDDGSFIEGVFFSVRSVRLER